MATVFFAEASPRKRVSLDVTQEHVQELVPDECLQLCIGMAVGVHEGEIRLDRRARLATCSYGRHGGGKKHGRQHGFFSSSISSSEKQEKLLIIYSNVRLGSIG